MEGCADGWPPRDGQDYAGQGRGHRVRHHFLQRVLLDTHLQVPGGEREAREAALRNGEPLLYIIRNGEPLLYIIRNGEPLLHII